MPRDIIAKNKLKYNNFFYITTIFVPTQAAIQQILKDSHYFPRTPCNAMCKSYARNVPFPIMRCNEPQTLGESRIGSKKYIFTGWEIILAFTKKF